MIIEFDQEYLRELYEDGKTTNKKHRLQPQVIKQYVKTVDVLKNAPNTEFLYRLKSLHYEKKEGDLKGIEAVYINMQYRIEFKSHKEGNDPDTVTICSLMELSHHYKK